MSWGQTMLRTTSTLGVGTQRPSCPGRRSETGEQHDVGWQGEPSPPARCPCELSPFMPSFTPFPAPLQALMCPLPSQECPFCSQSLERAVPVLQAQGEAPLRVRCQTTRTVTWGIWGQSQVPSSSLSFHPHPISQISPGRPQTLVRRGKVRGAALGPGSHFLAQSLSLCGKLLKVIKHPEVVKCAVNEVLINTPQEKIKRHH